MGDDKPEENGILLLMFEANNQQLASIRWYEHLEGLHRASDRLHTRDAAAAPQYRYTDGRPICPRLW